MSTEQRLTEALNVLLEETDKLSKDSIQRVNMSLATVCVLLMAIYQSVKK